MSKPWFDPKNGALLLNDYIVEMESFKHIMADNMITDNEIAQQSQRVMELLRRLEGALPAQTKDLATDAICELGVLSLLQHRRAENPN